MKICCICGQPFSSYYRINAYKIYCERCWRGERERALQIQLEARSQFQQYEKERQQHQLNEERIEERISELRRKINSEESKRDEYQNPYYLKQLNEELRQLYSESRRLKSYGPKLPHPYINNDVLTAKYFESEAAEERYLEKKRKAEALKREEERKRREEERKRIEEVMRQYKEKKEKEEKEQKEKILSEIKPFELQIINGEDVSLDIKSKVARNTINQAVIDILKETDIERILRRLRENEFLNSDDEAYIKKKQSAIRKAKEQKRKLEKEKQLKIAQEKKNNNGCVGILLLLIIPSLLTTLFFIL